MKPMPIAKITSRSRDEGEGGAIIVLALVYILIVSLTVGALLTWARNDLNNTTKFSNASSLRYAATSATDAAIQSIRYNPIPSTTPTQGVPTTVSYCWSPPSVINGSTQVSDLTIDGYTVGVWCSTIEELSSSDTRDVLLYACQTKTQPTGASCSADPLLSSEVAIDDYPTGGGPTFSQQCNQLGDSCGAGTTLENWNWGSSSSFAFATESPQTIAFYNSSYTLTMTSDTSTYGTGTYQLYARGSGGGAITYGSLTSSVCTVSPVGLVTLVSAGTCTLTGDAAATEGYTDSGVSDFTLHVNQASTTATVVSSLNPSTVGSQVTYTATIAVTAPASGTPTGSVEFFDTGSLIGTCTAQSLSATSPDTANCAIIYNSSGAHTITAEYLGNSNFAASAASPSITQTVNSASYSGGSGAQSLPTTPGDYYLINANQAGTASGTGLVNEFTPGVAETLTSLSLTINSTSGTTHSATVYLIASGHASTTALTCSIAGGSGLKTCSVSTSVSIPAGDSINLLGIGNANHTATWTITYTQP